MLMKKPPPCPIVLLTMKHRIFGAIGKFRINEFQYFIFTRIIEKIFVTKHV